MSDAPEPPSIAPGDKVGRYHVVDRIGEGGMAQVYRAEYDGELGYRRQVVLKMVRSDLAPNAEYGQMFIDEARLTAHLSHPNLPQTYELGVHEGRLFLAMEHVDGVSLSQLVRRAQVTQTELKFEVVFRIMCQLLECLHYVHGALGPDRRPLKIVHRDVSPGNVLVTDEGALKLLDFGIARGRMQMHRTATGTIKGKVGFMSPEQVRAEPVDHRTDIYAAGTLMYLMALGEGPFDHYADDYAILQACQTGQYRPPEELNRPVPDGVLRVIRKAMAMRADDRYSSAGNMLDAIEALALELKIAPSARAVSSLMSRLFPDRAATARTLDGTASVPPEPRVSGSRANPPPPPPDTDGARETLGERGEHPAFMDETTEPIVAVTRRPAKPVLGPRIAGPAASPAAVAPVISSDVVLSPLPAQSIDTGSTLMSTPRVGMATKRGEGAVPRWLWIALGLLTAVALVIFITARSPAGPQQLPATSSQVPRQYPATP